MVPKAKGLARSASAHGTGPGRRPWSRAGKAVAAARGASRLAVAAAAQVAEADLERVAAVLAEAEAARRSAEAHAATTAAEALAAGAQAAESAESAATAWEAADAADAARAQAEEHARAAEERVGELERQLARISADSSRPRPAPQPPNARPRRPPPRVTPPSASATAQPATRSAPPRTWPPPAGRPNERPPRSRLPARPGRKPPANSQPPPLPAPSAPRQRWTPSAPNGGPSPTGSPPSRPQARTRSRTAACPPRPLRPRQQDQTHHPERARWLPRTEHVHAKASVRTRLGYSRRAQLLRAGYTAPTRACRRPSAAGSARRISIAAIRAALGGRWLIAASTVTGSFTADAPNSPLSMPCGRGRRLPRSSCRRAPSARRGRVRPAAAVPVRRASRPAC